MDPTATLGASTSPEGSYEFSSDWFGQYVAVWNVVLPDLNPSKILEVGSYEGRSTCYMLEKLSERHSIEIYCVDPWIVGDEDDKDLMRQVEQRFDKNIAIGLQKAKHPSRVVKRRGFSHDVLPRLLAEGHGGTFDFIYVDGSHQAPRVLADAVMAFYLLRVGGLLIFDDYLWQTENFGAEDFFNLPKPAIDAFLNIFRRKVRLFSGLPLYQVYAQKTAS